MRLRATRERIADRKRWCQGALLGFDMTGTQVCVLGALGFASGKTHGELMFGSPSSLCALVPQSLLQAACEIWNLGASCITIRDPGDAYYIWRVNDTMGHVATLAMLDRAIEIETQAAKG